MKLKIVLRRTSDSGMPEIERPVAGLSESDMQWLEQELCRRYDSLIDLGDGAEVDLKLTSQSRPIRCHLQIVASGENATRRCPTLVFESLTPVLRGHIGESAWIQQRMSHLLEHARAINDPMQRAVVQLVLDELIEFFSSSGVSIPLQLAMGYAAQKQLKLQSLRDPRAGIYELARDWLEASERPLTDLVHDSERAPSLTPPIARPFGGWGLWNGLKRS